MDLLYETAISRAVPAEASEKTTWTENYYSEVLPYFRTSVLPYTRLSLGTPTLKHCMTTLTLTHIYMRTQVLSKSGDLKTDACCTPDSASLRSLLPLLRNIHEEVTAKYYGCGLVAPTSLAGNAMLVVMGCRDVLRRLY